MRVLAACVCMYMHALVDAFAFKPSAQASAPWRVRLRCVVAAAVPSAAASKRSPGAQQGRSGWQRCARLHVHAQDAALSPACSQLFSPAFACQAAARRQPRQLEARPQSWHKTHKAAIQRSKPPAYFSRRKGVQFAYARERDGSCSSDVQQAPDLLVTVLSTMCVLHGHYMRCADTMQIRRPSKRFIVCAWSR